ncbi:type II toxin-antitoxin system PemK/MazF family toxin [Streptomyces gobiensis]|uniref:type II toxin-antitoxin system PemK/MazF family toxin n=1 Tax=Streptomyces gobiensis TaxID=2875706 RepID=UPI001E2ACC44|nr:type II toxin-antitoxin system PemK/MazF family toxin [Streptomyces gobiensis]UGY91651.1 type II toxin-antitoxin system PemK/MazF family toxin [Streptomyces gobiensis]
MDTSWWLALGAVVALALVAALVDGRMRLAKPRQPVPPRRQGPRPPGPMPDPEPGEIWWGWVPYDDGARPKDRPYLVLSVDDDSDGARVMRIISKWPGPDRPQGIALPPGTVDDPHGRPSFLVTDELRDVPLWDLRRRAGAVDSALWKRVRHVVH